MRYDDILRKIYTAQTYDILDECADMIYEAWLDGNISEEEKDLLCDAATEQGNRLFEKRMNIKIIKF